MRAPSSVSGTPAVVSSSPKTLDDAEDGRGRCQVCRPDQEKKDRSSFPGKSFRLLERRCVHENSRDSNKGMPWSIVVAKNGKKYPPSGAMPYEAVKQLIELALQEK